MTQAAKDRIAGAGNRFTDAQVALANARHAKANGRDYTGYVTRARLMHRIGLCDLRSAPTPDVCAFCFPFRCTCRHIAR